MSCCPHESKAAHPDKDSMCADNAGVACPITQLLKKACCVLGILSPVVLLLARLKIAMIFFASGILKLPQGFLGIGQGDWSTTLLLFESEHPVPFLPASVAEMLGLSTNHLPPALAAFMGVSMEMLCPVLLTLGLATRLACLPLLAMTAVIEFSYQSSPEHAFWALLLALILTQGPGLLSLDALLKHRCCKLKKPA